jgi:hypothetical protein
MERARATAASAGLVGASSVAQIEERLIGDYTTAKVYRP